MTEITKNKRGISSRLRKVVLAGVTAVMLTGTAFAAPAYAGTEPSGPDLETIRERMTSAGLDSEVQDSLIDKLLAGEVWDSMSGATPVNSETEEENGYRKTFLTFADGSYSIQSAQIPAVLPEGEVSTKSVTECTHGAGAGRFPFWNCRVATSQALFAIDYYMDGYTGSSGTWFGSISNVHDIGYWTGAATVNSTDLSIVKAAQNGSGPAYARATLYVTFLLGSGSGTYKLTGYVDYGSIYDTSP